MPQPCIHWLKQGHPPGFETALVGPVVVGRLMLDGDRWMWHASLPHSEFLTSHGDCETEREAKEHLEQFLRYWLQPFNSFMGTHPA